MNGAPVLSSAGLHTLTLLNATVAAANPRTVVVINSDGAAYMPWLSKLAGVVEAW